MRPIFKPEIEFLKKKLNISIPENKCWMDRMRIVCINEDNRKQTLYRLKVKNGELLLAKQYKVDDNNLKSWDDIVNDNINRIYSLEQQSLDIINRYNKKYSDYQKYCCTSEGKDSRVLTYLVRQIIPDITLLFNNTSIDSAETYMMAKKEQNCIIINPKQGFYQWRKSFADEFIPTRFNRACCTHFKELPMVNYLDKNKKILLFYGMRNSESIHRSNYTDEWRNNKWATNNWIGILPIRHWNELDIWNYIFYKNIEFNPIYTYGYSRVGCIVACPNRTNYENLLDQYFFPKQYNRWKKILTKDFYDQYKGTKLNCTLQEYINGAWKGGVVREVPTREVIQEFAEYQGLDYEIAKKYFNKICSGGCVGLKKKPKKLKKDEIGLSMKYFGRHTTKFYCMNCLQKILGKTKEELYEDIKYFKSQGCQLF